MVHFFPKLCRIAFTGTQSVLATLTDPNSEVMKEMVKRIVREAEETKRRKRSWMGQRNWGVSTQAKVRREDERRVEGVVRKIVSRLPVELEKVCGGSSLSHCCWEAEMKAYILSFP